MEQGELLDLLEEAAAADCSYIKKLDIMDIIANACLNKDFGFEDKSVEKEFSKKTVQIVMKVYRDVMKAGMAYRLPQLFPFFALMSCDEDEINLNLLRAS